MVEITRRTRSSGKSSGAAQAEPNVIICGSVALESTASASSLISTVSARRGGREEAGSGTAAGRRRT